jgi:hypothetical protein
MPACLGCEQLRADLARVTAERDAARAEVEAAFVAGQNDCGCNGLPARTWAEHHSEHKL